MKTISVDANMYNNVRLYRLFFASKTDEYKTFRKNRKDTGRLPP